MTTKNRVCPWWVIWTFDNPLRKLIHNPREILSGLVDAGQTALDIGCGMGFFTIEMACEVGPNGQVIAADLQEKMLAGVRQRANQANVQDRIQYHLCQPGRIGLAEKVDFALAFWMVHEVPEPVSLFREVFDLLKPNGKLLIVEPMIHVTQAAFQRTTEIAQSVGLRIQETRNVRISRAILLSKS